MENRIKGLVAGAAGVFATAATRLSAAAQDTAAAGNGGTSDASAGGGAVGIGDVNSGGNSGSAIGIGDVGTAPELVCDKYGKCYHTDGSDAAVAVDGGDVSNSTSLDISADGGTAISDASGGDNNFAFVS
jgi:hypothetical protein